nr:MAG TPA: hypothetical protein [Caudoviricetes sp.]
MSIDADNKTECYRNCKALCTCRARKLLSEIQKRKASRCRRSHTLTMT